MKSEERSKSDHAESLVATYQPAFQMLFTSRNLLKLIPSLHAYYKTGEKIPEHKKVCKGIVSLCALQGWECKESVCGSPFLIAIPISIANALDLIELIDDPKLNEVCEFDLTDDFLHITAIGSFGLARFWGASTALVREKFPKFKLPFGFDTEIFFKPEKFS